MDRVVNEGKNIANYMLLNDSQNISISFLFMKKYHYLHRAPFSQSPQWTLALISLQEIQQEVYIFML